MKNRIIIIVFSVVVLAGVYFGLTKLNTKQEENNAQVNEQIPIFDVEKDSINKIEISTPNHAFTFYKKDDQWAVAGMEGIKLYNVKIDNLAYDFASINADTVIEDVSDNAIFGFNSPLGTPSVILTDGSKKEFIIGNKTPTGGAYYFKTADDDTIYTVYSSKIESFLAPLDTYREQTIAKINIEQLTEIQIKRRDADIVLRQKSSEENKDSLTSLNAWKMLSPYQRDVASYYFDSNILQKIGDINVSKFIEDNPTDYSKYGLDNPKYLISFTEKDKSPIKLLLGNIVDDEIYVKLHDEKQVYTVAYSVFEYRDIDPMMLVDTLAYIQMIDTVDNITLKASGDFYTFKIERGGEKASYFINDTAANEDAFKKIYQQIIGLTVRGIVTEMPQNEALFVLTFTFNDNRANDIIEGIPYQDRYVAIKINGIAEYYVLKDQVQNMLAKVRQFAENPL
ncbi:MAG: DUF4340 domain-containing protein [Clostridiaceae bacterium]|nr:DUF4340 domain-containing protein [Clostridiaceae bacterium]